MNKIEKLKLLPETPGVYIMLDENKNVLYVGKAKNLKNRVRQYFQSPIGKPEKVLAMVSRVYDFNYIIVPSETDAFALENTLIKKYTPPYNILLKDGKQYPYIKINTRSPYPKILLTRKVMDDHCRYFGPIVNNSKSLLEVTNKLFPTVTCNYNLLKLPKNFRPCLNYHIGKCPAPCINAISKEDYKARIDKAIEFLSGNDKEALTLLTQKMTDASEKEQYEEALNYRNYIQVINKLQESRIATLRRIVDYDIFAISSNGNNAVVNHTVVRAGKVVLSDNIPVSDAGIDEKQTLTSYISLYGDYNTLCGDIITNLDLEDSNTLSSFLSVKCNRKITVSVGARGERRKLAEMSYVNACDFLVKSESSINKEYNRTLGAVTQLKEVLSLSRIPNRIECYDISNISGVDKVASMVVTQNGKADNSSYRRFKIKTVEGANDFACMKEVLSRRFAKLKEGDLRFGTSPDLIVVDGGLGQLSYAMEAKKEAGVDIEIISLAEKEELVYTERNNEPIFLPRNSFALNLLTNTRDEAHRFAITYFRSLHEKNSLKTILSEISGIGDKKQLALFKSFKTADNIKKATQEEIAQVDGISKANAKAVYEFFKERTDEV